MCDFFDDFDAESFAFWGGFIETQLEGEKEEKIDNEPLTPDEMLETPFDYLDIDEEEQIEIKQGAWLGHPLFT